VRLSLNAEARGVFVNFTAAWCVTCKVNEAAAFTPRVAEAFSELYRELVDQT